MRIRRFNFHRCYETRKFNLRLLAAELQSNMIDFKYVARKMRKRMMCVLCKHVERHCSCLHSAPVASKHFLLFQLMHTIIKIIEC